MATTPTTPTARAATEPISTRPAAAGTTEVVAAGAALETVATVVMMLEGTDSVGRTTVTEPVGVTTGTEAVPEATTVPGTVTWIWPSEY